MSKPELKILIGMHRTANAIDRKTAQIAGAYGLTLGQFSVLEALYHKGDLTVGQVQEAILSTSGTIPVIVGKLEKEGMLTRCQDDKDRRKFILHLTDKGRELIAEVYPKNEEMIISEMGCWSDDEKEQMAAMLLKFRRK